MKYFIDLDDTLISSTTLNNDAYNFALENFGYDRIITNERITRNTIKDYLNLNKIIELKQKYFSQDWLPYRVILNSDLIYKLKNYGKSNCYLWTKADKTRTNKILEKCNLTQYFCDIIFDNKENFIYSTNKLKNFTNSNQIVIYENNQKFFINQTCTIIEQIKNKNFDIKGYLV